MIAVDFTPGFETAFAEADPLTRYAAFIRDGLDRRRVRGAAGTDDELSRLLRHEALRLRTTALQQWDASSAVLAAARGE
jgi:hypothetical protein